MPGGFRRLLDPERMCAATSNPKKSSKNRRNASSPSSWAKNCLFAGRAMARSRHPAHSLRRQDLELRSIRQGRRHTVCDLAHSRGVGGLDESFCDEWSAGGGRGAAEGEERAEEHDAVSGAVAASVGVGAGVGAHEVVEAVPGRYEGMRPGRGLQQRSGGRRGLKEAGRHTTDPVTTVAAVGPDGVLPRLPSTAGNVVTVRHLDTCAVGAAVVVVDVGGAVAVGLDTGDRVAAEEAAPDKIRGPAAMAPPP